MNTTFMRNTHLKGKPDFLKHRHQAKSKSTLEKLPAFGLIPWSCIFQQEYLNAQVKIV